MNAINKKNVTIYYGLIMATYSIGYVTLSAFSSLFLLDIGLNNGTIGIILALASLISVLLQPPVGALIDNNPKVSTKAALLCMGLLIMMIGVIIVLDPFKNIVITSVLYGINIMLLMLAQPFLNALGMDAINYGYPIHFGVGRGMGSFGYAVGSLVFGRISVIFGPKSVPIAFSIAFFVLCILLYIYPVKKTQSVVEEVKGTSKGNSFLFLTKYKRFAIMLLGLVLVYFGHAVLNTFALQVVMLKNGTSGDMGTAAFIAAFCEFFAVLFFPVYVKKIRLENLLRISCVFFTLKILFSMLVPNVPGFFAVQILQTFGWGIISIGIVYYVNELVGEFDKAQGQAYAGMAYTIASVVGTLIGGVIIDAFGVNLLLLLGTILAVLGTIIVWVTVDNKKSKNTTLD